MSAVREAVGGLECEQVVLATKFGNVRGEDGSYQGINGRPTSGRPATPVCSDSASTISISTTSTEWIRRCR